MKIRGITTNESNIIDSLKYQPKHIDTRSIQEELSKTYDKLIKQGYLESKIISSIKTNDSTFVANLSLKLKTTAVKINVVASKEIQKIISTNTDTIAVPFIQLESFLSDKKKTLEAAGYILYTFELRNISKKETLVYANLEITEDKQKKINGIVFAENSFKNFHFPAGHLKQINKKFKNSILSQNSIARINQEFQKYSFVRQTKYPETLFTNDSTFVYVYLEKQNANTFDGFIGFNNNTNQKINISGYLDLQLENSINAGEEFKLNWKSDGNNQRTFNSSIEIPYVLKSPFGIKGQINIFKQDSTFQNTRTNIEVSYFLQYNTRIYFGREATTSSDIQNLNNDVISDFKSNFLTSSFNYTKVDRNNYLNPEKVSINLKLGIGQRENTSTLTSDNINKQNYIELKSHYTFYLSKRNHFNIKGIYSSLQSNYYSRNELYRFGGINSFRGLQENSLQAKTYLVLATEYRYILNPTFYINTVIDYAFFNLPSGTTTYNFNKNLISAGLGFGLLTKNGLIKLSTVKNYNQGTKTSISNTLVHLSYAVRF